MCDFWQAFEEATQDGATDVGYPKVHSSASQRLVLDLAPRPLTETVTTQPFNHDQLVFEEQSPDGWLY